MRQAVWDLFETNMHDLYNHSILLKPVIKQCKSSYMLFAVTLTQHLLVAGIQRRKRRNFLIRSRGLF